jgi:hypothetical protein
LPRILGVQRNQQGTLAGDDPMTQVPIEATTERDDGLVMVDLLIP